jgi:hypothetical protein
MCSQELQSALMLTLEFSKMRGSPSGICGGLSGVVAGFFFEYFGFPAKTVHYTNFSILTITRGR